jgi:hypothetical protein
VTARAVALAVATLALAACGAKRDSGSQPTAGGQEQATASPAARQSSALTDAQLVGQHVVFPFAGRTPPRALLARIRRG